MTNDELDEWRSLGEMHRRDRDRQAELTRGLLRDTELHERVALLEKRLDDIEAKGKPKDSG